MGKQGSGWIMYYVDALDEQRTLRKLLQNREARILSLYWTVCNSRAQRLPLAKSNSEAVVRLLPTFSQQQGP